MALLAVTSRAQGASSAGQTTNGPCSPIFNGNNNTNNCVPPARHVKLTDDQRVRAIAVLDAKPGRIQFRWVANDPEVYQFVTELKELFRATNWTMLDKKDVIVYPVIPIVGVGVAYRGDLPTAQSQTIMIDNDSQVGRVAALLSYLLGPGGLSGVSPHPELDEDTLTIIVGLNLRPQ